MRLIWSDKALCDLEAIRDYIYADDPVSARKVALQIIKYAERITWHTALGRPGRIDGTRELVIGTIPYIIPYRVIGDTVEILRVLHSSRKWPEKP